MQTWQGYGVRSCLKLMLNKLKEMRGPISMFIPLWEPSSGNLPMKLLCVHWINKLFENLPN
jgi:hypothetical protein